MNQGKFDVWLEDFTGRFPDSADWINKHPQVLKLWYEEILGHIEQQDCLQANREIFQGIKPRWEDFRRETIGATVGKAARDIAYARVQREQKREEARAHSRKYKRPDVLEEIYTGSMATAYRRCREWRREGVPEDERMRRLEEML